MRKVTTKKKEKATTSTADDKKSKENVDPSDPESDAEENGDSAVADGQTSTKQDQDKSKKKNSKKTSRSTANGSEKKKDDKSEDKSKKGKSTSKSTESESDDDEEEGGEEDEDKPLKNINKDSKSNKNKNDKPTKNGSKDDKSTKKSNKSNDSNSDSKDKEDKNEKKEENEEEDYEVEDIVGHKASRGKILYRIRWKGYTAEEDTWEPESTLSCPEIVKKYADAHPEIANQKTNKRKNDEKGNKKSKKAKTSKGSNDEDEAVDENKDWEVKRILDVHYNKNGSKDFLIRWKGYSPSSDTWEPEDNLNCPELINKYMEKVDEAKNSLEKELRTVRKHTNRFTLMQEAQKRRLSKRHDGRQRAVYYDAE